MARELFGTDGIRGRALEWPLDEATMRRLGVALTRMMADGDPEPSFLLGGDTRASTETLADWLSVGIQAAGGSVTWGGVLPSVRRMALCSSRASNSSSRTLSTM